MEKIEFKTPDRCIAEWYRKLSTPVKAAFYSALILGLMTHLYQFTNKLYNYDELANTPGGIGLSTEQGRWLLNWMGRFMRSVFGGSYSLPFFNGIFALLLLSISAALIVSAFQVKSPLMAGLIGGLTVTFPAVVSMYFFMFLALYYALGIFFSVLAAYLVIRFPKNIWANIGAVLLIMACLGTYQAYFPNTVCLLLMAVILKAAFGKEIAKKNWKEFFFLVLRFLGVMAAGLVVYFIANKAVLQMTQIQLTSYQGGDSMGKITFSQMLDGLKRCYKDFFALGFTDVMGINYNRMLRRLIRVVWVLFGVGAGSYFVMKKGAYINKIIVLCGFLLFPVAMFLIYVMAPVSACYTLMIYPAVYFFIFFLVWTDAMCYRVKKAEWLRLGMNWGAALTMTAVVGTYIWYANGNYMALEYTKYHDFAYYQAMITQVKSVEGYHDDMPVIVVGQSISDVTNGKGSLMGDTFVVGGKAEMNMGYNSALYILSDYLGFSPYYGSYEEIKGWMEREEVQKMPSYPDAGSICVMDDTVIVKLSDY